MKKIGKILSTVFVIIITIYCSSIIIQKIMWKDKTPNIFGVKNYIVLSGSMDPTIEVGDIVFVKETKDVKEKDIIAFKVENSIVTHRVVEKIKKDSNTYYRTKGDANKSVDNELVKASDIEGRYVFRVGKIGKIIMFLKTKFGLFYFVICLIVYLYLCRLTIIKDRFKFNSWEETQKKKFEFCRWEDTK